MDSNVENRDFNWAGWPGFPKNYTFGSKIKWEEARFKWDENPYTWDEVRFVILLAGVGADVLETLDQDEEKKKKFIKLVCKVKVIETYSGQKTVNTDIKITTADVNLVIEQVMRKINLTVENIHV